MNGSTSRDSASSSPRSGPPGRGRSASAIGYFLTADGLARRVLFRHRYDAELHHLTVKGVGADTEMRVEVNLDLGHHRGNQDAQVDAFLDQLGVIWRGTLHKTLEAWYFPDCEVVYYEALASSGSVRCVEFEATAHEFAGRRARHAGSVRRRHGV